MNPSREQYPRRHDTEDGDNWGMVPFLLGVAAIGVVGVLVLTSSS